MANEVVSMIPMETCPTCHGEKQIPSLQARINEAAIKRARARAEQRADALENVLRVWDYVFVWAIGLVMPGGLAVIAGLIAKLALMIWSFCLFSPVASFQEGTVGVSGVLAGIAGFVGMCLWLGEAFSDKPLNPWAPHRQRKERAERRGKYTSYTYEE